MCVWQRIGSITGEGWKEDPWEGVRKWSESMEMIMVGWEIALSRAGNGIVRKGSPL
jgi:hypothetical protein